MPPLRFPTPATSPPDQPTTPPLPPLTVRAPRPLPDGACLWDALRAAPRLVDDAFWLGLRYAADREVRPHLRFALFAQGFVRLFVLPQPEAHCVRCLVLTRRACMARDVRARLAEKACAVVEEDEDEDEEDALLGLDEDPPFLELLRACAVGPTAGSEWPGSGPVVVAGGDNDGDGDGSFRLHSHQRASLAWMRAVEGEAEKGAVVALAEACPPLTVGDGLLTIDCHGAVRTGAAAAAGYQRREQQRQKDWGEEEAIKLPRGGLLAHPVGAGKTAIAASLLLPNPSGDGGPTLILAPDHILFQWRRELAQVLSGRERPSFALVGFEELRQEWRQQERLEKLEQQQQSSPLAEAVDNDATEPAAVAAPSPAPASSSVLGRKWGRLILDEGQLVQQDEALYEAVLQRVHADVRW